MPLTEGEAAEQALQAEHFIKSQRGPKVPMPQGRRELAEPYIHQHYQGPDSTRLLGDPGCILLEQNPSSKYVWRTYRKDPDTAAKVRLGVLRPVQVEEINPDSADAEYLVVTTAEGDYVVWKDQALFEMPAKWVRKYYSAYQDWAVARLAQQVVNFPDQVESATRGAYTGSLKIGNRGKD